LVVLPPSEEPATPSSAGERAPDNAPPPPAHPSEPVHIDVGIGAAVRVGGNVYVGGGLSALADIVVDNFVLGVGGRWEIADGYVSEPTAGGFNMESGALGVVVGRRAHLRWAILDALADAQFVIEHQGQNTVGDGVDDETLDARFGLALRMSFPRPTGVRGFLLADVEASPARILRPTRIDPSLPPL